MTINMIKGIVFIWSIVFAMTAFFESDVKAQTLIDSLKITGVTLRQHTGKAKILNTGQSKLVICGVNPARTTKKRDYFRGTIESDAFDTLTVFVVSNSGINKSASISCGHDSLLIVGERNLPIEHGYKNCITFNPGETKIVYIELLTSKRHLDPLSVVAIQLSQMRYIYFNLDE